MRIEVKGRGGVVVDDDLRARIERRFEKIARQVPEPAELDLELHEEKNPSIHDSQVAEATLRLKGTTLRAKESADNMAHAVNLVSEDLARQVKRNRDKRRGRRVAARPEARPAAP
ncbi:MAG: putative sigma-54 modulation protein [Thermoleophilaceae bacterium]|jgi:putative sigma-54 modulation protein|nr:putative sigma-54 modulation protein [Thermoleophilaceae bacterium]